VSVFSNKSPVPRLAYPADRAEAARLGSRAAVRAREIRSAASGGAAHDVGDVRKRLGKTCSDAGVPRVTMHAFRRSMVKFYSDAGVDQAAIMQFTGHRTDSMFRRYRIVDTTSHVLAAKKVARWADELAAETPTRGARTKH
jgi:integrase